MLIAISPTNQRTPCPCTTSESVLELSLLLNSSQNSLLSSPTSVLCSIQSPCTEEDTKERCSQFSLPFMFPLVVFTADSGVLSVEREGATWTAAFFTSRLHWHPHLARIQLLLNFPHLHVLHLWLAAYSGSQLQSRSFLSPSTPIKECSLPNEHHALLG